eukprot:1780443-Prymnesium_polylepis.1
MCAPVGAAHHLVPLRGHAGRGVGEQHQGAARADAAGGAIRDAVCRGEAIVAEGSDELPVVPRGGAEPAAARAARPLLFPGADAGAAGAAQHGELARGGFAARQERRIQAQAKEGPAAQATGAGSR